MKKQYKKHTITAVTLTAVTPPPTATTTTITPTISSEAVTTTLWTRGTTTTIWTTWTTLTLTSLEGREKNNEKNAIFCPPEKIVIEFLKTFYELFTNFLRYSCENSTTSYELLTNIFLIF